MKLIIILSVVACSYAAKLDRTYLPPANAATAGGTPGSLTAPGSGSNLPSGPSSFTQAIEQGFKAQSGPSFQSSKPGFESASQYQPGSSGPQFGQSSPGAEGPAFGQAPTAFSGNQGSFGNQVPEDATAYSGQYQQQPERAQASADRNSEIIRYDSQNDGNNYAYNFETSNGITVEESGVGTDGVQAQGGYSYTGDDGQQYRVTYTADENGYQPQGDHLPTPHPIPEEILKSLEENARAAAAGTQEGAYQPEEESNFESQQYNNGAPTYQGQAQPSGQASSAYNQPGQAPSSQYGAPGASRSDSDQLSGSQGYQYQAGSNQRLSQNAPSAPGFSFPRGQAPEDQGPSPSTPTGSNVFAPSGPRQPAQNQGKFGSASPARQGQAPGQSGYQYSRPEASSPSGKTNQPGQFSPQQTQQQPSGTYRPQSQGPAYSKPQSFGPTGSSGQAQGPSNQGFGPAQGANARGQENGPTFGSTGPNSGPASPAQGSPFLRPNGDQAFTPTGPSANSSSSQGSTFPRPSTSSTDNGYVYGPGISSGPIAAKSSGQGLAPSGSSGPAGHLGSFQGSFSRGPIGQGPASNLGSGFAPQGSKPSGPAQPAQESAFPRPNGPVGGPTGTNQGPFGGASQYQPSAQPQATFPRPNGFNGPKAQGPFGAALQYQPNQPSPSGQTPLGPAFPRPISSAVGPNDSASKSQGPFGTASQSSGPKSSMPNQSAPYQYNRPGSQVSQSGPAQNTAGYQPGFGAPEGRSGQTFGEPRQPPSFSPEEGYKY